MRFLRTVFLLCTLLAGSAHRTAADRTWLEIQSPHFTILCNGSEKEGREAAVKLERVRTVLIKALPSIRRDPNVPIIVFVTTDEETFATLVPMYRQRAQGNKPSSIFQSGRDRDYIVMREVFRGNSEYQLEYDYAGMMAQVNFRRAPIWLATGLAGFFAISEIREDKAKVGLPSPAYTRRLQFSPLIPLPKFFTVHANSPEYTDPEQRWVFEAESWGIFHYLILGDQGAHRLQLDKYLQLLAQRKKQLDAAQEAFGDLGKFQDKLGLYYRQRGFPFAQLELSREDYSQQLTVRALPVAESNSWLAEYHLRFKRQAEAKPLIDAALAENPHAARAHEAQGLYDLELGDYEKALKEFSAATAGDSSLYLAYYYKGILSSYAKSPTEIPETSEQDLRRAVELNPRYAPAAMALARLVVRRGGRATEAVGFAGRAVEAESDIVRYHLAYANILLLAGDPGRAETEARQTVGNEMSPLEEQSANALFKLAQECKPGGPCKALEWHDSASDSVPTAAPAAETSTAGATSQDAATPLSRAWGVINSISCVPEGRVLTLTSGGKNLAFKMTKTTRVSWPETFWLDGAYLDVCKHFAGEPARVVYKPGQTDPTSLEATAVEIQDRY